MHVPADSVRHRERSGDEAEERLEQFLKEDR